MAKSRKNGFLHGARGLFAFSVLVFHVVNSGLAPKISPAGLPALFGTSLQYGVELFFGISGIVILGARRRAASTATFLIERCTRIYPVLWATIVFILLGWVLSPLKFPITWSLEGATILVANALAMTNVLPLPLINPAAWTLSYEFCFYILVGSYLSTNQALPLLRKCLVVVIGGWLLVHQLRAVFFLSGIFIAEGLFSHRRMQPLIRVPTIWLLIFLLSWSYSLENLQIPIGLPHILQIGASKPWIPALMLLGLVSGTLALAGIINGHGLLARLIMTSAVQQLGTISYSLYLWQAPIMAITKRLMIISGLANRAGNFAQPLLLVLSIMPVLLVATASQRLLEVRVTNWLRTLLEGRDAPKHVSA